MLHRIGTFLKGVGVGAALCAGVALAVPAFADPPAHAPAHGWRKKNDPYYVGYTGRQWPADYGIIEGRCNRDAIGAVIGGVVGGAIGSQVGEGSDRKVAIILGTVIGAVIGREIGRDLDQSDRACMGHALELARDGQSVRWLNSRTGVTYVVTPVVVKNKVENCRTFKLQASKDGKSQSQDTRACRSGDGTWQMAG
jgi:surface antigen